MKILIAGGTGFIGKYLQKRFEESGHSVRVISRNGIDVPWNVNELVPELEKTEVLINLAGKSINSRFTDKNKELILKSRIETTHMLNEAVAACNTPPGVWINASATGIYRQTGINELQNELSDEFSDDFLGNVVRQWENEFFSTSIPNVRKTAVRTSVVLGRSGGAFPLFRLLTVTGLGGKQGSGRQMVSWIHIEDYFQIILFLINKSGNSAAIVNASAPKPVTNKYFMESLRNAKGIPFGIPAPAPLIRIATAVVGVDASLILGSVNVNSVILQQNGFEFIYPEIDKAFGQLIK